jgi:hypothetical protein
MCFLSFGRHGHSSIAKAFILKMEITFILAVEERQKEFQDSCVGSENAELYNMRNSRPLDNPTIPCCQMIMRGGLSWWFPPKMWRVVRGVLLSPEGIEHVPKKLHYCP